MKIRSLRNVKIGKVRYKRSVDYPRLKEKPYSLAAHEARNKAISEWLEENCEGRYYVSYDIKFEKKQDAILFHLRFA